MGFIAWIKKTFNNLIRIFGQFIFIEDVFDAGTKVLIAELKDYAIDIVSRLMKMDMTNEQKRNEAFKAIKQEGILRGKTLSSSLINLIIELALQYVKNKLEDK
jgi:hypothetical protein